MNHFLNCNSNWIRERTNGHFPIKVIVGVLLLMLVCPCGPALNWWLVSHVTHLRPTITGIGPSTPQCQRSTDRQKEEDRKGLCGRLRGPEPDWQLYNPIPLFLLPMFFHLTSKMVENKREAPSQILHLRLACLKAGYGLTWPQPASHLSASMLHIHCRRKWLTQSASDNRWWIFIFSACWLFVEGSLSHYLLDD